MKYIHFIYSIFIVIISGCAASGKTLPFKSFEFLVKEKNVIVISCLRCSCVDDELLFLYKKRKDLLLKFDIYSDSACKVKAPGSIVTNHISQSTLDSMSADLYNLAIIYKSSSKVRLVTTAEMKSLEQLLTK